MKNKTVLEFAPSSWKHIVPAELVLLLALTNAAYGAVIFVDNTLGGNCSGNYSIAARTCSGTDGDAYTTIQAAADATAPGDTVNIRGGTYYPTAQTRFSKAGNEGSYITVRSYLGELPVIDGQNVPEGDINGGSTPTWAFINAAYWKIQGPIHLTNGRGSGVYIDSSQFLEFDQVETSYNGKRAARAGHGFFIWSNTTDNILFTNCDGHHNANHLWRSGEDQVANQYQHGDGWRIFGGTNIRLEGCRAWHNLDDGYDYTQAPNRIEMVESWAAYSGIDDADGSITGTPNLPMPKWEGDGIKLGYVDDIGPHRAIQCLSWNNNTHGWTVRGGPYEILNSAAYNNTEETFSGIGNNAANVRQNTYGYLNRVGDGGGAATYDSGFTLTAGDFVSLDDTGMLGPRMPDGSLPQISFLKPSQGSTLVDAGIDVGLSFEGTAPDIGPFEYVPAIPTATLTAIPIGITENESTSLTWSSTNAVSCTGTNFATGGATSGSVSVSPVTDTTYTIDCDGATDSVTVTVTPAGPVQHTVNAVAQQDGSLDPATPSPRIVNDGATIQFTFHADSSHYITSVTGCGLNYVNTDKSVTSRTETTGPVTGACTVTASFEYYFPWPLFMPAMTGKGQQ